ncbi:hypothetical protein [Rhizobium ruizarguesonis]|uniref:hypothetical protein n=1 Tax=Rhizobium ruizarguesonis TaxID=2081791 RepID=UPI0013EF1C11|nr:hypothetical protein [Rhizobium ruizarguesonis]
MFDQPMNASRFLPQFMKIVVRGFRELKWVLPRTGFVIPNQLADNGKIRDFYS